MERPHAIVVGAGVAGLASACALGERGWRTTVLERRPGLVDEGQAFLLQPNGLAALARLGVLDEVRAAGTEVGKVVFHDRGREPAAVYDYRELDHPQALAIEIRPRELRRVLAERAVALGVDAPRFGTPAAGLIWDGWRPAGVRCENGEEVTGDLVVAADGRGSRIRDALGIRARRRGSPTAYILGTVAVRRPTDDLHVYCGNGYANGVCPLPDGTYFWDCVTDENRAAVARRDLAGWREVYERRVESAGEFVGALESWDQLTELEVRPFYAATRLVAGALLVGDAAGAVHPHSAQGANMALEDAGELPEALAGTGRSDPGGLAAYARRRQRKLRRYVIWSLLAAASLDAPNGFWRVARKQNFRMSRLALFRRLTLRGQAGLA